MKSLVKIGVLWTVMLTFCWGTAVASQPLSVFVSILPQKTFVQQIGGDRVTVQVMVQPGASPATYEPRPRQMSALSRADIYFSIGVAFESFWLEKFEAANPSMKMVHTDRGIEKRAMAAHHHGEEAAHQGDIHEKQGGRGEEDHHDGINGLDPHIWLSPSLVKVQAGHILAALKAADPGHAQEYEENYRRFLERVSRLDTDLEQVFAGRKGLRFMVFHPAWGYFAQAYGLTQVPIEMEGKAPKPAQLQEVIGQARAHGIRLIFVQPQFSTKSAKVVAREIGGQVAFADPLAEDWEGNLRRVAEQVKAALR